MEDKIKLRAVFMKDGKLHIVDSDGRPFDFVPEHEATYDTKDAVQIEVRLEAPLWPYYPPHVEVTFRMPVEVESPKIQGLIDSMTKWL